MGFARCQPSLGERARQRSTHPTVSKHERSQLVERVGKLQAEQNQGRDHQIGAEMHGGLIPEFLLEMVVRGASSYGPLRRLTRARGT